MGRLDGTGATRLASLLIVAGLGFFGIDLAMLFAFGRVEGSPSLPQLPVWAPILSLGAVIIGVRLVCRLRKPRARSKPFDWPERRRL